ncbi:4'-phosphopantetheinyl transferase superfamily protein [Bacillus cereus]|nr:4'-phosphopantetheinyl transferase superfamily protein [Bacillus cereus]
MKLYALEIPLNEKINWESIFLDKIPVDRQNKVQSFKNREDALRSLFGSLIVNYILWKELGVVRYTYYYNKYNKPYILEHPQFYFNLSHSGKWVICITDLKEVGVDIERVRGIDLKIAERFFSNEEYMLINSKIGYNQLLCFYEYWTMKEAFVKALGKGLEVSLDSFHIKKDKGLYKTIYNDFYTYYFKLINLDNLYKLAVCSENEDIKNINIEIVTINKLKNIF